MGFNFTFDAEGSIDCQVLGSIVNVTWSTFQSGSDDDNQYAHCNIYFPATFNLQELNDDWEILLQDESKLELQNISGGDGSIDLLTFQKNDHHLLFLNLFIGKEY